MDKDREHFFDYPRQTQVKHEILKKYLNPWLKIMLKWEGSVLYYDAFAGRGYYEKEGKYCDGSPLLALKLAMSTDQYRKALQLAFTEPLEENFADLRGAVDSALASAGSGRPAHTPIVAKGTFQDGYNGLVSRFGSNLDQIPPTLLFADPCGLIGLDFQSLVGILRKPKCESLIFLNYSGLSRVIGDHIRRGTQARLVTEIFGGMEAANEIVTAVSEAKDAPGREHKVVEGYRSLLASAAGARYSVPFRIEYESKAATSHYLVFVSKNPLGFRIMKDIMWKLGNTPDGKPGLLQRSEPVLLPGINAAAQADDNLLNRITATPENAQLVIHELAESPSDPFAPAFYKDRILTNEGTKYQILTAEGMPVAATDRPMRNKRPTLGESYLVRKIM